MRFIGYVVLISVIVNFIVSIIGQNVYAILGWFVALCWFPSKSFRNIDKSSKEKNG